MLMLANNRTTFFVMLVTGRAWQKVCRIFNKIYFDVQEILEALQIECFFIYNTKNYCFYYFSCF